MYKKQSLILIVLIIFCLGISIEVISANENCSNITSAPNDLELEGIVANNDLNITKTSESTLKINEETSNIDAVGEKKNYVGKLHIWIYEPTIEYHLYSTSKNALKCGVELLDKNGKQLACFVSTPTVNFTVSDQNGEIIYAESQLGKITSEDICTSNTFPSNNEILKNVPDGTYTFILSVGSINMRGSHPGLYSGDTCKWTVKVPSSTSTTSSKPTSSSKSTIHTYTNTKSNHYIKYIKIGKYKVKVWSDDSLNTQKNRVIKYLNQHVKKAHTFKIKGYKFKVSAKMYRKILYYKKFGYDGKVGYSNFKVKTNKYYTYKVPIYNTKKVTKNVWKYKKVLSYECTWGDGWSDSYTHDLSKYYKNGWKYCGYSTVDYSYGFDEYTKLKKKVKTTVKVKKLVGYKKVKLRVYAYGVESRLKVGVQFWGLKNGQKYTPITNYILF